MNRKGLLQCPLLNNTGATGNKGFVGTNEFLKMKTKLLEKQNESARKQCADARAAKQREKQEFRKKERQQYDHLFESLMNGIQLPPEEKKNDFELFDPMSSARFSTCHDMPRVSADYDPVHTSKSRHM